MPDLDKWIKTRPIWEKSNLGKWAETVFVLSTALRRSTHENVENGNFGGNVLEYKYFESTVHL